MAQPNRQLLLVHLYLGLRAGWFCYNSSSIDWGSAILKTLLLRSHWGCGSHTSCVMCSVMSNSLQPHGLEPTRLLSPWNFPGEYWSGFLFPPPGDLLDPGTKPASPVSPELQADSLSSEPPGRPVLYFSTHPDHIEGFLFFCWWNCCLK